MQFAELLEARRLFAAVAWDGGPTGNGTDFLDPVNWANNTLPLAGDTATIGATGTSPTITISGTPAVQTVTTSRPIQLTGGTISGGSWTFNSGASLQPTTSGGTLSNVAISGDVQMNATSSSVLLTGNTSFSAARLQANNAQLFMAPGYTLNSLVSVEGAAAGGRVIRLGYGGSGTVTFGPSAVVRLASTSGGDLNIVDSSTSTLVNNGSISAEDAGRTLAINNTTLTNNGTLQVTAGTLNVTPTTWTNPGTVTGTAGGTFNIGGTLDATIAAGIGTFNTSAITVNVTGNITNTGKTINLNGTTGSWNMAGGAINNGSVNESAGAMLLGTTSGGTLSNVAVSGDVILNVTSSSLLLTGSTTFNALRLQANNAQLLMAPGSTLNSLVSIEGAAAGSRVIRLAYGGSGTVTFGSSAIVRLASTSGGDVSIVDSSTSTLINNGLISAEDAGRTLAINNTTLTNNGTLQVTAGTLNVAPTNWTNPGTVTGTAGGTFNIGGTFDATIAAGIGTFNTSAITVNVAGTITNTGKTIALNATTGSWNFLGGTINNGSVTESAGAMLLATTSGGTLSNVAVSGDVLLNVTSSSLLLAGATTFTAMRLQANNAQLYMAPGSTLNSLVSVEGAAAGGRVIRLAYGGSGTVTFGSSAVVRLASTSGGDLNIVDSSTSTLVNNGLISAEGAGRTLAINNSTLTNNGTLQVTNGTLSVASNSWTNPGTVTGTAGGTFNIGGGFNATGATGIGTFNTSAITVNVTGTITNTGKTIALNATTGSWNLLGGAINNGALTEAAGAMLLATTSGGTLSSVTISGDLLLNVTSSSVLLTGNTSFSAARLQANNAQLFMAPGYTLNSLVSVEGAAAGGRVIRLGYGGSGTVTFGPSAVVRLASTSGGDLNIVDSSTSTLINNGSISAEDAGRTLAINNTTLTNNGTLQVTAGTLNVAPTTWTNPGTVTGTTGGTFNIGGTLDATGAAGIGTFNTSAITVNVTGNITNTGKTINLNATTGSWNMAGGAINNGSVNESAGAMLLGTTSGGTLSNVAVSGDVILNVTSSSLLLTGSTTFNALRLQANNAQLLMAPGSTLNSLVSIEGAAAGSRVIRLAYGGSGTVTFGSSAIVRLASTSGGDVSIVDSSTSTLINNGLISAEDAGRTLAINNTTLTNNGTLQATAGTLSVGTNTVTLAGSSSVSGTGALNVDSSTSVTVSAGANQTVSRFRTATLTIAGNAVMAPNGTSNALTIVNTLSFSGSGKLDLNDNDLLLDYSGTSQRATIQGYVVAGRAGGAWTGGPITSTTAKNNVKHNTSLGVLEATEYKSTGASSFDGQGLDNTAVLVKYTYYGDSDFNGKVNADDYGRIDSGYQNQHNAGFVPDWFTGDLDYNGSINADDYALIDAAYQTQSGLLRPANSPSLPSPIATAASFGRGSSALSQGLIV